VTWDWVGFVLGAALGWGFGWWRHRDARRARRAQALTIRDAEATVARAGPIIQREIDRLEREIARERARHTNGA
jgi:hypothetical protein